MFDGPTAAWQASLVLRVHDAGGRSLLSCEHRGPLRVQKALHPEGDTPCHAVLLHPPGGIAGGDALDVRATVEAGAQVLVTTPGATKWYKANGRPATQTVRLDVAGGLEWLPQEAIVYNAAEVNSSLDIALGAEARTIGWDIVALGRAAAGERFERGQFAQTIRLRIGDDLLWVERTRIHGNDALLASPIGLAGRHVFGCLWAAGIIFDDEMMERLRTGLVGVDSATPTRLAPTLVVARAVGFTTHAVRTALQAVWATLRPVVFGRTAVAPRIWAT